jgi:hypothetical protein
MSVLAICVQRAPHAGGKPRITQLHTNLWSFRTAGIRRYVVDLGLNILNAVDNGDASPVDSVDLFLPFALKDVSDITPKLKDLTTAELIFNDTCQVASHGRLTHLDVGGKPYRLGDAGVKLVGRHPKWSRVRITFTPPVNSGEARYVRVRLQLDGSRCVLWSQGGGLASALTAYDIRFYEKRQWAHDITLKAEIAAMETLDIDVCQYFLIVPAASILVEHAPPMKAMRLLEAGEWETYLDRNIERASVYYWKHGKTYEPGASADPIGPHRPYRVYAKVRVINTDVIRFSTWLPLTLLVVAGLALAEAQIGVAKHIAATLVWAWNWAVNNRGLAFVLALAGSGIFGVRTLSKRRRPG